MKKNVVSVRGSREILDELEDIDKASIARWRLILGQKSEDYGLSMENMSMDDLDIESQQQPASQQPNSQLGQQGGGQEVQQTGGSQMGQQGGQMGQQGGQMGQQGGQMGQQGGQMGQQGGQMGQKGDAIGMGGQSGGGGPGGKSGSQMSPINAAQMGQQGSAQGGQSGHQGNAQGGQSRHQGSGQGGQARQQGGQIGYKGRSQGGQSSGTQPNQREHGVSGAGRGSQSTQHGKGDQKTQPSGITQSQNTTKKSGQQDGGTSSPPVGGYFPPQSGSQGLSRGRGQIRPQPGDNKDDQDEIEPQQRGSQSSSSSKSSEKSSWPRTPGKGSATKSSKSQKGRRKRSQKGQKTKRGGMSLNEMDDTLNMIYSPENNEESAGLGESNLSIPKWIENVNKLFPKKVKEVMEKDLIKKSDIKDLMDNPELWEQVEPSLEMVNTIISMKHMLPAKVKHAARKIVKKVVDDLKDKFKSQARRYIVGAIKRDQHTPIKVFRNLDWKQSIRRNLKNYNPNIKKLIMAEPTFFSAEKKKKNWQFVVLLDESGSMSSSIIYSVVMASIFTTLPAIKTNLAIFDTQVVDLSDKLDDPVEILMSVQLGGGTHITKAVKFGQSLIRNPKKCIMVIISDFYEGYAYDEMTRALKSVLGGGTQILGIAALGYQGEPFYNHEYAKTLKELGIDLIASTPEMLPEVIAKLITK